MRAVDVEAPMQREEMVHVLRGLLRSARDAQRGFTFASDRAREPSLRLALDRYAVRRATFVAELGDALGRLGGPGARHGTMSGPVHRGWIRVRRVLEGGSDWLLIEECLAGERALERRYRSAMDAPSFAECGPDLRDAIESQHAAVRATEDELMSMRSRLN
jgi:uncharacterized protein (TIGR02284 family)